MTMERSDWIEAFLLASEKKENLYGQIRDNLIYSTASLSSLSYVTKLQTKLTYPYPTTNSVIIDCAIYGLGHLWRRQI